MFSWSLCFWICYIKLGWTPEPKFSFTRLKSPVDKNSAECLWVMSSFQEWGSGQNMALGILVRSIVSTGGSYKNSPAGQTSSCDFLPLRESEAWLCPFNSCHPWWDWMCSQEALSFPVRGGPGPPEGYWGVWPLGFGPTHLCKHHVWPPQRGPAADPDMDMQATVVLMCAGSLMLGTSVESSIRETLPPLVLTTCCLKDNITPCKQAADRLQVLGQE